MKLFVRKLLAILSLPFSLGYSKCGRCHRTWNICKSHNTMFNESNGCFPLCKECWNELSIEERIPYYVQLINEWHGEHREEIMNAVRAGK